MIRELVGHSATYTLANLISRGTVLVWLIVLPRFMSSADYGALGLILTTAALFNLVPLEIGQALGRYYHAADGDEKGNWASTAWIFTLSRNAGRCGDRSSTLGRSPSTARPRHEKSSR